MKYSEYQLQDFLADELFNRWIKENDPHVDDFWQKWLAAHPGKAPMLEEAARIIRSIEYKDSHKLSTNEYLSLYENILRRSEPIRRGYRPASANFTKIAAFFLLLIVASLGIWLGLDKKDEPPKVVSQPTLIRKNTLPGQKLAFKLPDGTKVKLNASSSIEFPKEFKNDSREVAMAGEAFFEVVEDTSRPFTVVTRDFSTTALGTSFNVFAYKDENKHRVSLLTGKVKVESLYSTGKPPTILGPGEQATFDKKERTFSIQVFDALLHTGWREGKLAFRDSKFSDVISTLERWYGVQIDVLNENKRKTDAFSGTFSNESLEEVLKVLGFSGEFSFRIKDKSVLIEFND